jgi:MGT family glycosyltransferase
VSRHVLFLSIASYAHVRPALAIAAELVRRGHRVSFVAPPELAGLVAEAGAETVFYRSTWPSVDERDPQVEIPSDAVAWEPLIFLREGRAATTAARAAVGYAVPDLVVYDATVGHAARALARDWRVPAAQIFTTFASNAHFSPIALVERLGDHPALVAYRRAMADMLHSYGLDDLGLPEFAARPEELSIVLLPREFQIAGDTFDDRFVFVGPALSNHGKLDDQESWQPPGDGLPILLIDLNSLNGRGRRLLHEFVRAFTGVAWHVVIALNDQLDPAGLPELPPNVELCGRPPRTAVLARASALVSQAGMGSTMEAQYFGVPVIAVPQTPPQKAVGRRITELHLGRCLAPAEVTAESLRDVVLGLGADDRIRRGVATMREHVRRAGGTRAAVDALLTQVRP